LNFEKPSDFFRNGIKEKISESEKLSSDNQDFNKFLSLSKVIKILTGFVKDYRSSFDRLLKKNEYNNLSDIFQEIFNEGNLREKLIQRLENENISII